MKKDMAGMKAAKQQTERMRLSDKIPMDTPLSMQIELASSCNFRCRFCMHHDNQILKDKGMRLGCMTMDTFHAVLGGLKKFPSRLKFITLQSRGESLLNRDILSMTEMLKAANVTEKIGLYTNGTLLDHKMSDGLVSAGLDVLHVSIEGMNREQYMEIARTNVNFEKLVEQVGYFYRHRKNCYLYVKTMDNGMTDGDKKNFVTIFKEISDDLFIERPVNAWQDAGISKSILKRDRYLLGGVKWKSVHGFSLLL